MLSQKARKVIQMYLQLLKNWKTILCVAISATIAFLSVWVYLLKSDLKVAHADYKAIESALTAQSEIIESNRAEYERNLADANKTKTVINTRYKERVKVIYQWGEENATCDDSMRYLNNYTF